MSVADELKARLEVGAFMEEDVIESVSPTKAAKEAVKRQVSASPVIYQPLMPALNPMELQGALDKQRAKAEARQKKRAEKAEQSALASSSTPPLAMPPAALPAGEQPSMRAGFSQRLSFRKRSKATAASDTGSAATEGSAAAASPSEEPSPRLEPCVIIGDKPPLVRTDAGLKSPEIGRLPIGTRVYVLKEEAMADGMRRALIRLDGSMEAYGWMTSMNKNGTENLGAVGADGRSDAANGVAGVANALPEDGAPSDADVATVVRRKENVAEEVAIRARAGEARLHEHDLPALLGALCRCLAPSPPGAAY